MCIFSVILTACYKANGSSSSSSSSSSLLFLQHFLLFFPIASCLPGPFKGCVTKSRNEGRTRGPHDVITSRSRRNRLQFLVFVLTRFQSEELHSSFFIFSLSSVRNSDFSFRYKAPLLFHFPFLPSGLLDFALDGKRFMAGLIILRDQLISQTDAYPSCLSHARDGRAITQAR